MARTGVGSGWVDSGGDERWAGAVRPGRRGRADGVRRADVVRRLPAPRRDPRRAGTDQRRARRVAVHRAAPDVGAVDAARAPGARTAARDAIAADRLQPAFKMLSRIARIFEQLNGAWDVLRTMTPSEYTAVPRPARPVVRLPVVPVPRDRVRARQPQRGDAAPARPPGRHPRAASSPSWPGRACTTRRCGCSSDRASPCRRA